MKIEIYYLYAIYVFLLIVQYILIPKFLPLAKKKSNFFQGTGHFSLQYLKDC